MRTSLKGGYIDLWPKSKENPSPLYLITYMDSIQNHLGSQIKRARNAAGLSVRALAEKVNIPYTTIEGFESGNKIPADRFLRIAAALNSHSFEVEGDKFEVYRVELEEVAKATSSPQMKFEFSEEYTYSRATVRIGPSRITVSFQGQKSAARKKEAQG